MMETIKVNMTPCEDVQTIHASQNDNEAREWGFELHNNGDKIDSSSISDQLVFKAYEGGTEQILPENGSTPTTSPFKGDIKYPQGLLSDQEFLYRESPTEEDGLAKITDIKGNTLVWNQLVQNGNFADTSRWLETRGTISASANVLSYTISEVGSSIMNRIQNNNAPLTQNHKYLMAFDIKPLYTNNIYAFSVTSTYGVNTVATLTPSSANTWNRMSCIFTNSLSSSLGVGVAFECSTNYALNDVIQIRNYVLFDLTKMGLDSITSASDFTSLFSLPYYDYNQGTLLSFNGNGIKTVGKNLVTNFLADSTTANISWTQENGVIHSFGLSNGTTRTPTYTYALPLKKGSYILSGCNGGSVSTYGLRLQINRNGSWGALVDVYSEEQEFTLTEDSEVRVTGRFSNVQTTNYDVTFYPMVRFADTDSTFEPYQESTLSLPTQQYFPTGMKSAGSVYDELTETKAITRIGSVDLGTLSWTYSTDSQIFTSGAVLQRALTQNGICASYEKIDGWTEFNQSNKSIFLPTNSNIVRIKDPGYTDATAFKTAMNGVYLYYELATETETSFTTASLVTENAEIPLSNEDGVLIGKCTEQLSSESGFFDAKIKLSDSDGECYSNKIQLHIERSPQ